MKMGGNTASVYHSCDAYLHMLKNINIYNLKNKFPNQYKKNNRTINISESEIYSRFLELYFVLLWMWEKHFQINNIMNNEHLKHVVLVSY